MSKGFGGFLTQIMLRDRAAAQTVHLPDISEVNPLYAAVEPFALGTMETKENRRRTRIDIYTGWQLMQSDPSIAEALSLHVSAALGGHESRGDVVFMTPAAHIRGKGQRAAEMRQKVEKAKKRLEPIINQIVYKFCRDGVGFGDAYMRPYVEKGVGVVGAICDEHTFPPLIQAFEQGSRTIGYHVLEAKDWERTITPLNRLQMIRLKLPRVTNVPQVETVQGLTRARLLQTDKQNEMPIIPSPVGGSFLFEVEEPWEKVHLLLTGMTSQQIADSVRQMFLSVDMSGMPPEHQAKYKKGLQKIITSHEQHIRKAMLGGDAIHTTQYHVLPSIGPKQVMNAIGDVAGQRNAPINIDFLMFQMRRLLGGMGSDPSMVGWADMLSGGLGDGAMFHTSAQQMRRSVMIRQALTQALNELADLDWGYAYGESFSPSDRPYCFEFYSDQSAAATEMLTNKQTRMNTLALTGQAIATIKELGLSEEVYTLLLESIGGMDMDQAIAIAKALSASGAPDGQQGANGAQGAAEGQDGADDQEDTE